MIRSIFQSKWATLVIVVLLVILIAALLRQEPALLSANREERQINGQIKEAEESRAQLEAKKEYFQSDAYLERQARIKLNYQKPGEQVVYIYHAAETSELGSSSRTPLKNWQRWWYYLVGK